MRGYTHALSGASGWLAVTSPSLVGLGWHETSPSIALAGTVLCAGAAMLPDMDHPSGTIAWSLPSVKIGGMTVIPSPTRLVCAGVAAVSGGHRHGTHCFVGMGVFTGLAWLATLWTVTIHGRSIALGCGLIAVLLVAFASKSLGLSGRIARAGRSTGLMGATVAKVLRSWVGSWVLALSTAGTVTWMLEYRWEWLPLAVAIGCFLHCAGDSLTPQGVPWLWPLNPKPPKLLRKAPVIGWLVNLAWQSNGYFRLPLIGKTDTAEDRNPREMLLAAVFVCHIFYLLAYQVGLMTGRYVLP